MHKTLLATFFVAMATISNAEFIARNNTVLDTDRNLIWYRCTIGMRFEPVKQICNGSPQALTQTQIPAVIEQANKQLGGSWRLPSKNELRSLVCKKCDAPKIDAELFPNFLSDRYWSGQKNWMSRKNYWSMNFYTGWLHGMAFPDQELYVVLVRDIR